MNQLLMAFGRQIAESGIVSSEATAELNGLAKVNDAVRHAEEELSKLSADKSQRAQMKSLTGSISSEAGTRAKGMLSTLMGWGKTHPRNALYAVFALVAVGTGLYWKYARSSTDGNAGATPTNAGPTTSSKASADIEKQMKRR